MENNSDTPPVTRVVDETINEQLSHHETQPNDLRQRYNLALFENSKLPSLELRRRASESHLPSMSDLYTLKATVLYNHRNPPHVSHHRWVSEILESTPAYQSELGGMSDPEHIRWTLVDTHHLRSDDITFWGAWHAAHMVTTLPAGPHKFMEQSLDTFLTSKGDNVDVMPIITKRDTFWDHFYEHSDQYKQIIERVDNKLILAHASASIKEMADEMAVNDCVQWVRRHRRLSSHSAP